MRLIILLLLVTVPQRLYAQRMICHHQDGNIEIRTYIKELNDDSLILYINIQCFTNILIHYNGSVHFYNKTKHKYDSLVFPSYKARTPLADSVAYRAYEKGVMLYHVLRVPKSKALLKHDVTMTYIRADDYYTAFSTSTESQLSVSDDHSINISPLTETPLKRIIELQVRY